MQTTILLLHKRAGLPQGEELGWIYPLGLVWEMEESSGWNRIEGDFGKF
jgi:hypothetical protein